MNTFIILCGGFGTRFQKVSKHLPKILAEIKSDVCMLDWLINEYLPPKSIVILATGYLHHKISEHLSNKTYKSDVVVVKETSKLGTGGAIINASRFVKTEEFVALNGDTIQELSICQFLKSSKLEDGSIINIGCTTQNKSDSGKITLDKSNFIKSFEEKPTDSFQDKNIQYVSSLGIYRCNTKYFRNMPISLVSLEEELLPELIKNKKAKASIFNSNYEDYGTYLRYKKLVSKNF